jgi:hypothetical protein
VLPEEPKLELELEPNPLGFVSHMDAVLLPVLVVLPDDPLLPEPLLPGPLLPDPDPGPVEFELPARELPFGLPLLFEALPLVVSVPVPLELQSVELLLPKVEPELPKLEPELPKLEPELPELPKLDPELPKLEPELPNELPPNWLGDDPCDPVKLLALVLQFGFVLPPVPTIPKYTGRHALLPVMGSEYFLRRNLMLLVFINWSMLTG